VVPFGTGNVEFKLSTTTGDSETITFKYKPVIYEIHTSGYVGDTLTFTGVNFIDVIPFSFSFGSTLIETTIINSTKFTIVVPESIALRSVLLYMSTDAGDSNPIIFTYNVVIPTIESFTPTGIKNSFLTIIGKHFDTVTEVYFDNEKSTDINIISFTRLTAKVPNINGTVNISLKNTAGTSQNNLPFSVISLPAISSIIVDSTGNTLTISGTNLENATSVSFDTNVITTVSLNTSNSLNVQIPSGNGSVLLKVTTSAGDSNSLIFTYNPVILIPTIDSINPTSGLKGRFVTITGNNMNTVTNVKFGDISSSEISYVSTTELKATVPNVTGSNIVSVKNITGTSQNNPTFTVLSLPTISSILVDSTGNILTITGTNLENFISVSFGKNTVTSVSQNTSNSLNVQIPSGNGSVLLKVTTSAGDSNPVIFTYNPIILIPTIDSINPTSGLQGRFVTITGTNMNTVTNVKFGDISSSEICYVSTTELKATVPNVTGSNIISVKNVTGTSQNNPTFMVLSLPTISSIRNDSAGNILTIEGSNLENSTSVSFGTNVITSVSQNTSNSLNVQIPSGNGSVLLKVTTQAGHSYPVIFTYNTTNTTYTNICFLAGTPIQTDQGKVDIERININKHTIGKNKIIAITKTKNEVEDSLVFFEKNSIAKNYPKKDTIISRRHKILYKGVFKDAEKYINETTIYEIKYNNEVLYNVLLDTHSIMKVNNLICETLHPENKVALFYKEKIKEGLSADKIIIQFKSPLN
jgi:hypothetical protein